MTGIGTRVKLRPLLVPVLVLSAVTPIGSQGRRVVDIVKVGDPTSEREHDYAGEGVTAGVIDGRAFRHADGWLSYSMAVYEDTEVTVTCIFRGSSGRSLPIDLFVEGRKSSTRTLVSPSAIPTSVEFQIPFEITKGLTSIRVVLRAVDGPTPVLFELRTVQEHLERPWDRAPRSTGPAFW